ncbi:hypothetical protein [Glaciecola sp.]|jgi:hypothetical protein|uniref:hypothetical protein n=1 Tax=Glaciecola sp. MF2-115 TaxID=3384827 RepID=UPI00398974EE
MTKESHFSNQIRSNYAFMAKSVFDLHFLIQSQSEELYSEKEMGFPEHLQSYKQRVALKKDEEA